MCAVKAAEARIAELEAGIREALYEYGVYGEIVEHLALLLTPVLPGKDRKGDGER